MTRIALLSVSAGAGHVRCAEALALAAARAGAWPEHIDVMDVVPRLFRSLYIDRYLALIQRRPAMWSYLYHTIDAQRRDSALATLRRGIENLNTKRLEAILERIAPDVVICTHFLPAQVMSRMVAKRGFRAPVWVVVTDFDLHALWIHPGMDGYCAAAVEVSWRMRDRGIRVPIAVTGIPIMPTFSLHQDRREVAAELGLDPATPTVLLMSGGTGIGDIDVLAAALLRGVPSLQVVAMAGRNTGLLERLRELSRSHVRRLVSFGFTSSIHSIMSCADLAVSKPGGLTTAECLAMGLPLLVVAPLPGQEERNADYLLEHGVGMRAYDVTGAVERVRLLFANRSRLTAMRAKALLLGRPDAADRVIEAALASRPLAITG